MQIQVSHQKEVLKWAIKLHSVQSAAEQINIIKSSNYVSTLCIHSFFFFFLGGEGVSIHSNGFFYLLRTGCFMKSNFSWIIHE